VLVHGGHLEHRHIQRIRAFAVVAGQLGITDGGVEGEALCNGLALNAAHMPAVPCHVCSGIVDLEDRGHPHQDAAAEVDTFQLRQTLCDLGIHRHRGVHSPAVIHPVAGLDGLDRLVGRCQLLFVHFLVAHVDLPPVIPVCCMMSSVLSYIDCQEYNIPALEKQSIP